MVQCMEAWFLADRGTVSDYFGNGFRPAALPGRADDIERIPKPDVLAGLDYAARDCGTRGGYRKVAIRSRFWPSWIPKE